ncbi:MAG: rRNA maturation RNase YbeY [Pseudomonadota bacterium]|nr:rRNA maturation RNase YbeY [Pseudomonadota bacterium]
MIKINVITNNIIWYRFLKKPNNYIDKKVKKLNLKAKTFLKRKLFCTLLLSGIKEIKFINKKFRKKDKSTDVLSFPFYKKKELKKKLKKEKEIYLGDVIININKIKKSNKPHFRKEFNKLLIHGLTHLFGYEHKKDKDYYIMKKVEKKFLSYLK